MSDESPSSTNPDRSRFQKGRSGNPGGRPTSPRAPQAFAFDIVLKKTLTVPHKGGTREISVEEGIQQKIFQNALAGKRTAQREVLKWIQEREAWLAKHAPKLSGKPIEIRAEPDPENADAALVLLGIAMPDPARAHLKDDRAHLLFEPWAVQATFDRRRGGNRLTKDERETIRRFTRDPESLRWPRGTDHDV
jgi:hypothetical protein